MQLSDFTRVHWIIIGLLGGLLLSYMWTGETDIDRIRAAEQREFERDVLLKDDKSGLPFISNIIIHPAEDSPTGKVNVVLYKKLAVNKNNKEKIGNWLDKRLIAKIPYVPAIAGRVPDEPDMTINTYLTALNQQQGGGIHFHYGWWLEPGKAMALGSVGGVLLVGGIWPTLLSLMAGAGFGPKPSKKDKKKIDWGSFLRKAPSATPTSKTPVPSVGNPTAGMNDVTRAYEQNLAPSGSRSNPEDLDAMVAAGGDPSIIKLDGGPLEAAPAEVMEAEEIEVKGEYYPVVIRHTKKPE